MKPFTRHRGVPLNRQTLIGKLFCPGPITANGWRLGEGGDF